MPIPYRLIAKLTLFLYLAACTPGLLASPMTQPTPTGSPQPSSPLTSTSPPTLTATPSPTPTQEPTETPPPTPEPPQACFDERVISEINTQFEAKTGISVDAAIQNMVDNDPQLKTWIEKFGAYFSRVESTELGDPPEYVTLRIFLIKALLLGSYDFEINQSRVTCAAVAIP